MVNVTLHGLPINPRLLAAPIQSPMPGADHLCPKRLQAAEVRGNSVVAKVPFHHGFKPLAYFWPVWLVNPLLHDSFIHSNLPVYPEAIRRCREMRKTGTWTVLLVVVAFVSLNSCAMSAPSFKARTPDGPLKVVRDETPRFGVVSKGAGITTGIAAVLMSPVAVLAAYPIIRKSGQASEGIVLPDYLKLVMDRFTERIHKEKSDLPKMEIIDRPIAKKHKYKISGDGHLVLHWYQGFTAKTVLELKRYGRIIWRETYEYRSRKHGRQKTIEEFLANEAQLLREEMIYAADCTVSEFVNFIVFGRIERF